MLHAYCTYNRLHRPFRTNQGRFGDYYICFNSIMFYIFIINPINPHQPVWRTPKPRGSHGDRSLHKYRIVQRYRPRYVHPINVNTIFEISSGFASMKLQFQTGRQPIQVQDVALHVHFYKFSCWPTLYRKSCQKSSR